MSYVISVTSGIPGGEAVFGDPDLKRQLVVAIQAVLEPLAVTYGLTPQEAYEAYSVLPGITLDDLTETQLLKD